MTSILICLGSINIMAPFTAVAGILTYAWPYIHGERGYVALAVFYGFVDVIILSLSSIANLSLGFLLGRMYRLFRRQLSLLAVQGTLVGELACI